MNQNHKCIIIVLLIIVILGAASLVAAAPPVSSNLKGAAFNLKVVRTPDTGANTCFNNNALIIDHPLANNNPNAVILVTANDGAMTTEPALICLAAPIELIYDTVGTDCKINHWVIFPCAADSALTSVQSFNILIVAP